MKDLLKNLLPKKPNQGIALPRYSTKKRNKLITIGIFAALAVTLGIYLFITFNPLKSRVATLSETPDSAFSLFQKEIKAGNRRGIIARMSSNYKGGPTKKREVIKILEKLKGLNYKLTKEKSISKGNIHLFTYSLEIKGKSVTLTDEIWQKNPEENKWYLLKEAKNFQEITSLTSENPLGEQKKETSTSTETFYEVERTIPIGASILSCVKNLKQSHQKVKNTAFYTELLKIVKKKGITQPELTLFETAVTSLFGENIVYAHYGNSKNYLAVSKLSGSIKLLSPIIESILKFADKNIKIISTQFGNTSIKSIVSGENKVFYAFSKSFIHISDSELLLKNSLQLAENKKEDSILNNTEIFTFLTGLRSDYKYYFLGSESDKTTPNFFNYGYLEGNTLQSRTSTSNVAINTLSQGLISNQNFFTGKETFFDILPDDKYGFLGLSFDFSSNEKVTDFTKLSETIEKNTGIKVQETFTNKILFTTLSGSGTKLNNFFFPVFIAETKQGMAENILTRIAGKFNLALKSKETIKFVTLDIAPQLELTLSAISNNIVITLGKEGLNKVLKTFSKKHPSIKSSKKWNYFFGEKAQSLIFIYSLNLNAFTKTITEIYARSNINPLQNQQISKLETLDMLNLFGTLESISGKSQAIDNTFIDKGRFVFSDIDPRSLRLQTKAYMKKNDIDLKNALVSPMLQGFLPTQKQRGSTRTSKGVVNERKIEGFIYVSTRKRDPFAPSYLISRRNYEQESQNIREAESLYKEIEQESIRLENQFLKPITYDILLLDLIKNNEPEEYNKILNYAKQFEGNESLSLDSFEKRKSEIFAYNDFYMAIKSKYEEEYINRNKLPYHSLKSLALKGIAMGSLGSKALIVAGDVGYFIAEGDYISKNFYLVEKILDGKVQLSKKSFNYKLSPAIQEHILRISK